MADEFRACGVLGCNRNSHYAAGGARGWCRAHYRRAYKYGDAGAGHSFKGDALRWLNDHLSHDGVDCLEWPFARDSAGYGQINHDGVVKYVHRFICEVLYGSPPDGRFQAAHTCGKGHEACCNPKHLRWATGVENAADKWQHGTLPIGECHHAAKLTEDQVRRIRSLKGSMTQRRIGALFGVSEDAVGDIHRGINWAWLK